jgi:hypothetical protein
MLNTPRSTENLIFFISSSLSQYLNTFDPRFLVQPGIGMAPLPLPSLPQSLKLTPACFPRRTNDAAYYCAKN